ncbi:PLP-dependent lyase/thiolase [Candidatus Woesearchaeota archaeon]|nr:PLP-dependent lyase/thiolase [Candidatus Woesearchaeota archaeon]
MSLDRIIFKETQYPQFITKELLEKFADGIPVFSENDPKNPEWRETPNIEWDLRRDGYGRVFVKNEADEKSNPTGTIKDRPAWELATIFRDYARGLHLMAADRCIESMDVPRFSIITAGNVGLSVSEMFRKYGLPPMKLLVDAAIPKERLEKMKNLYADIYVADLSISYSPKEIKALTNNENGVDITSVMVLEPHAVFYDWHVHEAFNENPDEIYIPYGSGRLIENYLTWQERTIRNEVAGRKDTRLRVSAGRVIGISIFGAEPEKHDSTADKLTKRYNPFAVYNDQDIRAMDALSFTGKNTGVYKVAEERIKEAYSLMDRHFPTEPSASAGLALYLQRYDEGKINPRHKILIVNTGKGI